MSLLVSWFILAFGLQQRNGLFGAELAGSQLLQHSLALLCAALASLSWRLVQNLKTQGADQIGEPAAHGGVGQPQLVADPVQLALAAHESLQEVDLLAAQNGETAQGEGASKRIAEQAAATALLEREGVRGKGGDA